ncbi:MAG: RNA polymerase sigma factor [Armatimonadota bacterium]
MSRPADAQVVTRARQGDGEAFEALVRSHYGLVYAICIEQMGTPLDAEDLAQEAFVRAYRDLAELRDPAKFVPWMRRLTQNLCKMARRQRRPELEGQTAESTPPAGASDRTDLRLLLGNALNGVSETTRVPLSLHYFGGHSYKEIAAILEIPARTVRSRMHEGRGQLRSRLKGVVGELLELDGMAESAIDGILTRCRGPECACSARLLGEGR